MKLIFIGFVFLLVLSLTAYAQAEDELKVEGNCNGNLAEGTKVSFIYYSNFNGCQPKIRAAIKFAPNFGSGYCRKKTVDRCSVRDP
jgi:hypothetical protein